MLPHPLPPGSSESEDDIISIDHTIRTPALALPQFLCDKQIQDNISVVDFLRDSTMFLKMDHSGHFFPQYSTQEVT